MNALKDKKTSKLKYKNSMSKNSNDSLKVVETDLMQKKEQEHDEMFNQNKKEDNKFKKEPIDDKYKELVIKAVNDFSTNISNSFKSLSDVNKQAKKGENEDALRKVGLALFSSTIKLTEHMQNLSFITGNEDNVKVLENLIPFCKASNSLFLNMEKDDDENNKYIILELTKDLVDEVSVGIKYAELSGYGLQKVLLSLEDNIFQSQIVIVQKVLKKYEGKLKQLLKTIEEFENDDTDRMPLMGEDGAS